MWSISLQLLRLLSEANISYTGCAVQFPYTGQVCRRELSYMQDPSLSNSSQGILNVSVTNQEVLENFERNIFRGLPNFNPSPECEVAIRLFACLHYFQACDDNMSVLATGAVCRDVRDRICVREWMEIDEFLGPSGLPICEELPEGNADFGSE